MSPLRFSPRFGASGSPVCGGGSTTDYSNNQNKFIIIIIIIVGTSGNSVQDMRVRCHQLSFHRII